MGRTVVDTLAIEFELDDKDLKRGLKQATTTTTRATSRMGRAFARFERKVKDVGRSMLKFRAVMGLVAGAAGLGFLITKSINAADTLAKTADKVGLSTDSLQELRFGAELAGVNITTMDMAMQRFSRRVGEVAIGTGELKGTFERLGISVENTSGGLKTQDELLDEIADAIMNAKTEQERLSIAFKAFDSEGAALVNMLKDGAAGLQAFRDRARELGIVLDERLIRSAEDAKDAITELTTVFTTRLRGAILENIDKITELAERLTNLVGPLIDLGITVGRVAGKVAQGYKNIADQAERLGVVVGQGLGLIDPKDIEDLQRLSKEYRSLLGRLKEVQAAPGSEFTNNVEVALQKLLRENILARQTILSQMEEGNTKAVEKSGFDKAELAAAQAINAAIERRAALIRNTKEAQQFKIDALRTQELTAALDQRIARQMVYQNSLVDAAKAEQAQAAVIRSAWEGVENAGVNAIEAWLTRTKSLKESFKGLIADLAQMIIKAQLFNALSQFRGLGGGGGILGTIVGALFNPGKAGGGAASGPTLVGERGPEIVNFRGGGGTITNSADTRTALRGGGPQVVINADMRGASVDAVARLERFALQINASIEPRSIAAVASAQGRSIR